MLERRRRTCHLRQRRGGRVASHVVEPRNAGRFRRLCPIRGRREIRHLPEGGDFGLRPVFRPFRRVGFAPFGPLQRRRGVEHGLHLRTERQRRHPDDDQRHGGRRSERLYQNPDSRGGARRSPGAFRHAPRRIPADSVPRSDPHSTESRTPEESVFFSKNAAGNPPENRSGRSEPRKAGKTPSGKPPRNRKSKPSGKRTPPEKQGNAPGEREAGPATRPPRRRKIPRP